MIDIEVFARQLLKGKIEDVDREEEAVALLVRKTGGVFLYLQYARETHLQDRSPQEIDEGESMTITMEKLEEMPEGLTELYTEEFKRLEAALVQTTRGEEEQKTLKETLQRCLKVVVAAQEPVLISVMDKVLCCTKAVAKKVLSALALFFPERDGCVMVWHKSVRDWLINEDREGEEYWVGESAGHTLLADACVAVVEGLKPMVAERRRLRLRAAAQNDVQSAVKSMQIEKLQNENLTLADRQQVAEKTSREEEEREKQEQAVKRVLDKLDLERNGYLEQSQQEQPAHGDFTSWEDYCLRYAVQHLRHREGEDANSCVRKLTCDLRYVEIKAQAGMVFDLANEYQRSNGCGHEGGNAQGGGDECMYNFYRFALDFGDILHERSHLALQCAINWPDGLLPPHQTTEALFGETTWLQLKDKPLHLGAQLFARRHTGLTAKKQYNCIHCVCFSPDGRRLASGGQDGHIIMWDAASGKEEMSMAHGVIDNTEMPLTKHLLVHCVCFSPNGRQVASGGGDCFVKIWGVDSGEELIRMEHGGNVESVCFSPDGRQLVSGGKGACCLKLWDVASGEVKGGIGEVKGGPNGETVMSVCYSPDGTLLASGNRNGDIILRSSSHLEKVTLLNYEVHSQLPGTVTAVRTKAVIVLSTNTKAMLVENPPSSLDAGTMYAAKIMGANGIVQNFNGSELTFDGCANKLNMSDDLTAILSAGDWIRIDGHDVRVKALKCTFHVKEVKLESAFPGDAGTFVTERLSLQRDTDLAKLSVLSVCFSLDGQRLASGGDGGMRVWDITSGKLVMIIDRSVSGITNSVGFSPDRQRLVAGQYEQDNSLLRVWDVKSGEMQWSTIAHSSKRVFGVCFSPGTGHARVASCGGDGNVKMWDAESRHEEPCSKMAHEGKGVLAVSFSHDSEQVATGCRNGDIKVWNTRSGDEQAWCKYTDREYENGQAKYGQNKAKYPFCEKYPARYVGSTTIFGTKPDVKSLCFSPDGKHLFSRHDNHQHLGGAVWVVSDPGLSLDTPGVRKCLVIGECDAVTWEVPPDETPCFQRQDGLSVHLCNNDKSIRLMAGVVFEIGFLHFGTRIKAASFNPDGNICVVFNTLAPEIVEVRGAYSLRQGGS
jgi:WD40 repeat protein